MIRASMTGQRLVALFLLGLALFNFPILGLFESDATVFGWPALYFVAYGAWGLLVVAMAWITGRRGDLRPGGLRR